MPPQTTQVPGRHASKPCVCAWLSTTAPTHTCTGEGVIRRAPDHSISHRPCLHGAGVARGDRSLQAETFGLKLTNACVAALAYFYAHACQGHPHQGSSIQTLCHRLTRAGGVEFVPAQVPGGSQAPDLASAPVLTHIASCAGQAEGRSAVTRPCMCVGWCFPLHVHAVLTMTCHFMQCPPFSVSARQAATSVAFRGSTVSLQSGSCVWEREGGRTGKGMEGEGEAVLHCGFPL